MVEREVWLCRRTDAFFVQFADSRTAYNDLPKAKKEQIPGLIANHSLFHSRKKAVPEYFVDTDPLKLPLSKHKLVQKHEPSGRMVRASDSPWYAKGDIRGLQNLYIASYVHHFDGMDLEESSTLIEELLAHVSQPKYRLTIPWDQTGDIIIW